jgi:tetratricopeptide (TPR) repeat protein
MRSLLSVFFVAAFALSSRAAELKEAQELFLTGNYTGALAVAQQQVEKNPDAEDWQLLLSRALLTTGQYQKAYTAITNALQESRWSVRLPWQAHEVYLANGLTNEADQVVQDLIQKVGRHPSDFREPPNLVVFGRAALLAGADPKRVLETLYDVAKKADPKLKDVYLASGDLALDKHDYALAAKRFQDGLKQLPEDPDLLCGLARAYAPSEHALMVESVEAALERNSNHVGCLLLLAEHAMDAEDYDESEHLLARVAAINPWHSEVWAYRAVLAHMQNQPQAETNARSAALKFWPTNPRVDYLIGSKLSQYYRFAEGSAHQRQALAFSKDYLPAKAQLAQDLLRLGQEAEGWHLAEEVQKLDSYDVESFNLTTLHQALGKFATLTNGDFLVRMSKHEAAVYGARVLELLSQARSNLCSKYGIEVQRPTTVEIFPEQKDFAVRTFGMPGNPGYLGVCFGTVITANSPAAHAGHSVNWEAVLWHEFCHVVTLQLTHNKMPRWLSEGISVYEERQANTAWGQHMNPKYREMVLGDSLTPVSKLSGAFVSPHTDLDLQFAYYESSLVVEFIAQKFGTEKLKAILRDLGQGMEINQALAKSTEPMEKLEEDFTEFAHAEANRLAPGLDWEKPKLAGGREGMLQGMNPGRGSRPRRGNRDSQTNSPSLENSPALSLNEPGSASATNETFSAWSARHPTNFYALAESAKQLFEDKKYSEAKVPLQKLVELYPDQTGDDSAWAMLAAVHRALGETNDERQVLSKLAVKDADATDVYLRLMELGGASHEWRAVIENARRYLAVNPLVIPPYRFLAKASEQADDVKGSITAYRGWLELEPTDPAEVHFKLARALYRVHDPGARRQVLQALEEAPRYRAALELLLKINGDQPQS